MTGVSAVAALAIVLSVAIVLIACISRALGRMINEKDEFRFRDVFMESFTKAISRPALRGADLIRGMRSWGKD